MDGNGWKRGFIEIQGRMGFIAIARDETGLECYKYMKKNKNTLVREICYSSYYLSDGDFSDTLGELAFAHHRNYSL